MPTGLETEAVELVLPHGRSVRRRRVEGYALTVAVAVAVSALADAEPTHPSGAAWQAAARFALRLLADVRLHPALTPAGYDTWQVGPCTAAQRQTLDALAAAFPPHAHCLPEPGPAPVRIAEPARLVSQFCDAVADDLVRTPAAPLAMGALPYAWREARAVPTLRAWRHGGPTGITVAEQPHTPDPTVMKAARAALDTALSEITDSPIHFRAWRNRLTLTDHGIQLRLGHDARWYPYLQNDDGEWWPAAPADGDPVTALTAVWSQNGE